MDSWTLRSEQFTGWLVFNFCQLFADTYIICVLLGLGSACALSRWNWGCDCGESKLRKCWQLRSTWTLIKHKRDDTQGRKLLVFVLVLYFVLLYHMPFQWCTPSSLLLVSFLSYHICEFFSSPPMPGAVVGESAFSQVRAWSRSRPCGHSSEAEEHASNNLQHRCWRKRTSWFNERKHNAARSALRRTYWACNWSLFAYCRIKEPRWFKYKKITKISLAM